MRCAIHSFRYQGIPLTFRYLQFSLESRNVITSLTFDCHVLNTFYSYSDIFGDSNVF